MKITIVYDNEAAIQGLTPEWGFSCLVEADGTRLLFDTGAKEKILLGNLARLNLEPATFTDVFISHGHRDHIGGLPGVLAGNREIPVYLPVSCSPQPEIKHATRIQGPCQIDEQFASTGELGGIEQSLVVKTPGGLVVICGCAHPGVEAILKAASLHGKVSALIGGLHGFRDFGLLEGLKLVSPCHCTQFKFDIQERFPGACILGGAGKTFEL